MKRALVNMSSLANKSYKAKVLDMRSDTVTLPSAEMKKAMMEAPLGDDVFGQDPTVNALQDKVAKLLGKEAALLVPSGTMANLISVMVHCEKRGQEILVGDRSHIHIYEQGGIASIAGVHHRSLRNLDDGTFDLDEMEDKIRGVDVHWPTTRLVCIENTHNITGGKALPLPWLKKFSSQCKSLKLAVHLDGARILNAAVSCGVDPKVLTECADSVNMCMSKGVGAPVGSLIAGTEDFVQKAKRMRKALGGGMRQAGVLAAAAIYGLDHAYEMLTADHKNAKTLYNALSDLKCEYLSVSPTGVDSNMVVLTSKDISKISPEQFCQRMEEVTEKEVDSLGFGMSVLLVENSKTAVRITFNNGVSAEDTKLAIRKMVYVIKELSK